MRVKIHTGRVAETVARTYNTITGQIVYLTRAECKVMRLPGYSTGRYSYSVDMSGRIEKWTNGYGGWCRTVQAPEVINA